MAEITYLEAIREALFEEMERDANVFCIGEDIGAYGGAFKVTEGLMAKFGESARDRHADLGDRRSSARRPARRTWACARWCEMQFIDFIAERVRHAHQLRRDRALSRVPAVSDGRARTERRLRARRAVPLAESRSRRSSTRPGSRSCIPRTAADAKGLMKAAIRDDDCVLFFEHKYLYRRIKEDDARGRSRRADRQGARRARRERTSRSSPTRRRCGRRSKRRSSSRRRTDSRVEVHRPAHAAPLDDEAIIATVKKTNRVLDRARGHAHGRHRRRDHGAHQRDAAFEWLDAPVLRVTAADVPLPYAPPLEDYVLPQTADIVSVARRLAAY